MTCAQCKKDKSPSEFYQHRRKGWTTTKCWECGTKNMAKWARTQVVGRKADDVKGTDE